MQGNIEKRATSASPAIQVTALRWAPPFAQGLVRDIRVRWALEEAGLPYCVRLIGRDDQNTDGYRALQPFGQVPVYEENEVVLFESGSIVHHIAERSDALMPRDAGGRARTLTWMFAALNSIEPAVTALIDVDIVNATADWAKPRRPVVLARVTDRLGALSRRLEGREYLEDRFTAADLLMTTVLRFLRHTTTVKETPNLEPYRLRCEARPGFQKALADQMRVFEENAPKVA
jgi:glutathione S-transferase